MGRDQDVEVDRGSVVGKVSALYGWGCGRPTTTFHGTVALPW